MSTAVPGTCIADAGGRPPRRMLAVAVAVVAAAVTIAWANAFPGTFQFDDYAVIVDNPAVQRWAAYFASMPGIRPLLKASYTLSWTTGGGTPTAFVAFNVAIHAANAVLVLLLTARVLALAAPELRPRAGIALATALLFALHPAQTEAVTWIAGRATSLSAFFCLVAIVAWLRGGDRVAPSPATAANPVRGFEAAAGRGGRGSGWRATAMAAFVAALAVKETAVTVPFALLLLEALRRAAPPADDRHGVAPRRPWRDAWRATRLPFALLALAAVAAWLAPTYRRLAAASFDTRGPLANLAAQVDGVAYLIAGPLLRLRVNIDPDIPLTAFGPTWWLAAAALAALGLVTARALSARPGVAAGGDGADAAEAGAAAAAPVAWRSPLAGFALAWFLLHLAPTNSLLARFDLANDRQLYLALIGPALLAAAAVPAWRARRRRRDRWRAVVPALLVATLLGAATIARNRDYATEIALWEATVRSAPSKARAWNNLGYAYEQAGRRADARSAYQRALALDPDQYKARSNLRLLDDP